MSDPMTITELQLDNDVCVGDDCTLENQRVVVLYQLGNSLAEITMLPHEAEALAMCLLRSAAIARVKIGMPAAFGVSSNEVPATTSSPPIRGRKVGKPDRRRAASRRLDDKSRARRTSPRKS